MDKMLGTPTDHVSVKGANHFTIIHDLTKPDSYMVLTVLDLVEKPAQKIDLPDPDEEDIAAVLAGTFGMEPPDEPVSDESGDHGEEQNGSDEDKTDITEEV